MAQFGAKLLVLCLILVGGKLTVLHVTNKEGTYIKWRVRLNWKYYHSSWAINNYYGFI